MYISEVSLTNFRNFNRSSFVFKKGMNTIIGENGSGKSNVLYGIRLLLDGNLPMNASRLIESDFNRALDDWRGHWIIIKITFEELGEDEAVSLLAQEIEIIDNDMEKNRGTYVMYFRPKYKVRKKIFDLSENNDADSIEDTLSTLTMEDYETVFFVRSSADFNDKTIYRTLVGDFEQMKFPDPDNYDHQLIGIEFNKISAIRNEISFTFIKALRNVIADLKQIRQSPLLSLLRGTANKIEVQNTTSVA